MIVGRASANADEAALMSSVVGSDQETTPSAPAFMATMAWTSHSRPVGFRGQYLCEGVVSDKYNQIEE